MYEVEHTEVIMPDESDKIMIQEGKSKCGAIPVSKTAAVIP